MMIKLKSLIKESKISSVEDSMYWMDSSGNIYEVDDHVNYVIHIIDNGEKLEFNDDIPTKIDDGSIPEPEDIYEIAYKKGYLRINIVERRLYFSRSEGQKPTYKQMSELKNLCIENGLKLFDGDGGGEIELL